MNPQKQQRAICKEYGTNVEEQFKRIKKKEVYFVLHEITYKYI